MDRFLVFITFINDSIYRLFIVIYSFSLLYIFSMNYILFLILLLVLLAIILLRLIFTNSFNKGKMFEKKIQLVLEKYCKKNKGFAFTDCFFNNDNEFIQVDNILVTSKALYVIEAKNYSGWIYGKESDYKWVRVFYKIRNNFYNPILQNNQHIRIIKKILNLFDSIPVYNLIIFSDGATLKDINISSDNVHIKKDFDLLSEINYIERKLSPTINEKSFKYIIDTLKKNNITDKVKRDDYYKDISRKHINNY